MSDYQNRKDIDNLYFMIWDRESNELKLVTKEEFDETLTQYYDMNDCDTLFVKNGGDMLLSNDFKESISTDYGITSETLEELLLVILAQLYET